MRFSIFPRCGFQYSLYAVFNIPYMRFSIFPICGFQYSLHAVLNIPCMWVFNIPCMWVLNIPYMRFSIFPMLFSIFLVCGSQFFPYAVLNILYMRFSIFPMRFSIFLVCGSQYSLYAVLNIGHFIGIFKVLLESMFYHEFLYLGREAFSFREGRALENLIPEMDEHAVDLLKVKLKTFLPPCFWCVLKIF